MVKPTYKIVLFSFFSSCTLFAYAAASHEHAASTSFVRTHASRSSASPRRHTTKSSSKESTKRNILQKTSRAHRSADFSLPLPKQLLSQSLPSARNKEYFFTQSVHAQSTPSPENDQDLNAVININNDINEGLKNLEYAAASPVGASFGIQVVPRLTLPRELLEQAYRALALLELVKKKYPRNESVQIQIRQTLEYIYKLDPPSEPDGIPESACGSSGRLRRLHEMGSAHRIPRPPSPLAREHTHLPSAKSKATQSDPEISPRHHRKSHKKKHKIKNKRTKKAVSTHAKKNIYEQQYKPILSESIKRASLQLELNELYSPQISDQTASIFTHSLYEQIVSLEKKLSTLLPSELSPRNNASKSVQEKLSLTSIERDQYQAILIPVLSQFTPLIEHYHSGITEEELPSIEKAICSAYKIYARIIAKTSFELVLSEQTSKDIDICALVVKGIQTPRSKRRNELKLQNLQNNFAETMRLIFRNKKIVISGSLIHKIHDPEAWNTETITDETLFKSAKELLTKLKRGDDLCRLNLSLSRYAPLAEHPEIKQLMEEANKKIALQALQEREQLSPRHK